MKSIKHGIKIDYSLSLQDTMLIKGVAICFMLWHHLFYEHSEYGKIVQYSAFFGKVCVAMFLFVSAYGLTLQFSKITLFRLGTSRRKDILKFIAKRLIKLYVNYWVVFLIFVPLGVFFYHKSLQISYGDQVNQINHLILDFFGMQGSDSYNSTWWFYQLIIVLYIVFPLLYIALKKWNIVVLVLLFVILGSHYYKIPIIHDWLFPFALGISCALNKESITSFINSIHKMVLIGCISILFLFIVYIRLNNWRTGGSGVDGIFTLVWIMILVLMVRNVKIITPLFRYLGKHSMNIFMVHTFIFYYFYQDFIYSFRYPFLIFIVLISCSLCVSILIEYFKKMVGIYRLENKFIDLYLTTKISN
ncbi:MAG: acyltransferase [Paludibacter sp.]|nr:acyltransferase [Paludibacter sp.]